MNSIEYIMWLQTIRSAMQSIKLYRIHRLFAKEHGKYALHRVLEILWLGGIRETVYGYIIPSPSVLQVIQVDAEGLNDAVLSSQ